MVVMIGSIQIENILIYIVASVFSLIVVLLYLKAISKTTRVNLEKLKQAKEDGLFEPVSLHPVVDVNSCIRTGACISACPEEDILGIINGKATVINASVCIGHGACFQACPTEAISLYIGTEKRGVDLPHVKQNFETNVDGIFIAGELGGMGLIKNAVEQGKQAVENIAKTLVKNANNDFDLVIVGAGPAGISAALTAKKLGIKSLILEQDSLGGTVFTFPRSKVIMTSPMELSLYGKLKLYETSKAELLNLWQEVLSKNNIKISENSKVDTIKGDGEGGHQVILSGGKTYKSSRVLLAIGRRGTPRKLNIEGENLEKVAYRLLEPENFSGKHIVIVGGGDSAIEAAISLCDNNFVTLSYRGENFNRLKAKNKTSLNNKIDEGKINTIYSSNLIKINTDSVSMTIASGETLNIMNDLVFIFAGGELPTEFLKKCGIEINTKFGEPILKH